MLSRGWMGVLIEELVFMVLFEGGWEIDTKAICMCVKCCHSHPVLHLDYSDRSMYAPFLLLFFPIISLVQMQSYLASYPIHTLPIFPFRSQTYGLAEELAEKI